MNDSLYLEKKSVFQLFALTSRQPGYPSRHGYRAMDAVIERARLSVDDAFLYEGRRRGYISVEALAALSNEQVGISIHMHDFCIFGAIFGDFQAIHTPALLKNWYGDIFGHFFGRFVVKFIELPPRRASSMTTARAPS